MGGLALTACALLLVTGCTKVGPDFVKPDAPVAESWSTAGERQLLTEDVDHADWWTSFNDPVLDKLIDTAYKQNLDLRISGLRILEARARLGVAAGSLYPQQQQARAGAIYTQRSEASANSAAGDLSYWTYDVGFDLAWELDFWGKFRRNLESADAALLSSVADYDALLVSLTAGVANAYVLIRTFEERLAIARDNVQIQERSLRIADVRFRNGATTELDVQQAKTLLLNTQASIPALERGRTEAENALSILLGIPPGQLRGMMGGEGVIPTPPAEVAVGIPANLLRRRPDVRAAELQAAAQSALIGVAKADLYPSLTLFGQVGLVSSDGTNTTRSGSVGLGELFTGSSLAVTTGPAIQWNIFNYGQIKNNVRGQDARYEQLLANYQNQVLRAAREVEDASTGFLRSQEQAVFLTESVVAAKRSVDLAVIQYRDGAVDFTRVLNSQQALVGQQDQLTATRGDIALSLVDMYRALGGGWQIRQGQDFVPEDVKQQMAERTDWGKLLTPDEADVERVAIPSSEDVDGSWRRPDW
jgi:NodT family efflux transporter outer membrane factor (OMF) lipoprotein